MAIEIKSTPKPKPKLIQLFSMDASQELESTSKMLEKAGWWVQITLVEKKSKTFFGKEYSEPVFRMEATFGK